MSTPLMLNTRQNPEHRPNLRSPSGQSQSRSREPRIQNSTPNASTRPTKLSPGPIPATPVSASSRWPAAAAAGTDSTSAPAHPGINRSKSTVHLPLYRRILFPFDDPSIPVPPLVGGVGEGKEIVLINERIHNLNALALRAYVLSWYRFTSSRTLPSQIHASIIRPTLQPILGGVYEDPERLCRWLILDLPSILYLHWRVYWDAKRSADLPLPLPLSSMSVNDIYGIPQPQKRIDGGTSGQHEVQRHKTELGIIYHARLPLISTSLSDEGLYELSPLYLSALSSAVLKHTNPAPNRNSTSAANSNSYWKPSAGGGRDSYPADENERERERETYIPPDVERLMAREVLARSVLGSIAKRASEGWFWYMLVLKLLGEPKSNSNDGSSVITQSGSDMDQRSGSEDKMIGKAGLPGGASQSAQCTNQRNWQQDRDHDDRTASITAEARAIFQQLLRWSTAIYSIILLIWTNLVNIGALYSASTPSESQKDSKANKDKERTYQRSWEPAFLFLSEVVGISEVGPRTGGGSVRSGAVNGGSGVSTGGRRWSARLVWGMMEILLSVFGGVLDRILPHLIRTRLLTPHTSLWLIDTLEKLLFPLDGWPGPTPVDPTEEEAEAMRRRAVRRMDEVIPGLIKAIFFQRPDGISRLLDPLANKGCNAHLIAMLLDSLVAALIPALALDVGVGADVDMDVESTVDDGVVREGDDDLDGDVDGDGGENEVGEVDGFQTDRAAS